MSSKNRITFILIISISFIIMLFGISVYYFQRNYAFTDFYKRLETRVSVAEKYNFFHNKEDAAMLMKLRNDHLERLSDEREYILRCDNESSIRKISTDNGLPYNFLQTVFHKTSSNYQKENVFYHGKKYEESSGTYLIIVSAKNYYSTHHLALLRNVLIGSSIISIFIIIYLSYFFSKRIFEPINNIITKVNKISTDNIHMRLDEVGDNGEIQELASTFNNMLSRIEIAFETNKNFISNASHEFSTPLTAIIGEADVALIKERSATEYKEALSNILTQAERINKIIKSLLHLAQIGYKENKLNLEIVRTDEMVLQAKQIMNQLVPNNDIQINFDLLPENPLKLKVKGNKELMLLALTNLLSNACKYSDNKTVHVSLASTDTEIRIVIKDQGIGIPSNELPFIYDPFYRATNTDRFEGYGIGLPLTRNIIKLHAGELLVSSENEEGVTVLIRLPIAKL